MSSIVISGDTSGSVTLQAPAIAGSTVVTLPTVSMNIGTGGGSVATNTAFGASALAANTTGATNTAVGASALAANTTTSNSTAVGYQALLVSTASNNTAVGALALTTNTSGTLNTAIGQQALRLNTTGGSNTAVGLNSISSNTTGGSNTAVGEGSLNSNTTASNSTAVGYQAGYSTTTAGRNTLVGQIAGYALTTGGANVVVGDNAFKAATTAENSVAIGTYALAGTTTGNFNTAVGGGAGEAITTGSKNTIIGRYTGNQGSLDIRTLSNRIVISDGDGNPRIYVDESGATSIRGIDLTFGGISPSIFRNSNAGCSGFHFTAPGAYPVNGTGALNDNIMPLGNGSYRMSVIYAGTGTISTSDGNEKQDIEPLSDAELRVAKVIKGLMKKYRWKDAVAIKGDEARIHVGVIAQDIEAAFAAEGLDAHRYAMFCSDTSYRVNGQAMDKDGNWHTPETEGAVKFTRLGVRYDQVLAFLIAAM